MIRILFVCTGNTCRSPMAEGMMGTLMQREGLQVEVKSAGVSAFNGGAVSEYTMNILKEKGFAQVLTSNEIDKEVVEWADLILTMTLNHKRYVLQAYPEAVDKTYTLKEYTDDDPDQLLMQQEQMQFISEIQLKHALAEPLTESEEKKLIELQQNPLDLDIQDPFGGDIGMYRECAEEIEGCLTKLIIKLKNE